MTRNKALLKQTKREMLRRHRRHLRKTSKKKSGRESSEDSRGESGETDADSEEAATDFTSGSRPCPCCLQEATGEYSILKYRVTHQDG